MDGAYDVNLAIFLCEYVWMLGGWTFEFAEFFFPISRLISMTFKHVIPQGVAGNCIAFLTEMKTIDWHVCVIIVAIGNAWKFYLPQKWLIYHSKILFFIEFIQFRHLSGHLLPFGHGVEIALTQTTILETKDTRAFKMIRWYTFLWFAAQLIDHFHAYFEEREKKNQPSRNSNKSFFFFFVPF